jgi:hypothetical protein
MRKATTPSMGRMVLALIAVLAVAGPGLILAAPPAANYPLFGDIFGPGSVTLGGTATFELRTNGSSTPVSGVTWTARFGSFSGNVYTAPSSGTKDLITATFQSLRANRAILLQ